MALLKLHLLNHCLIAVFKENPLIGSSAFPFLTSLSILSLKVYVFRSAGRSQEKIQIVSLPFHRRILLQNYPALNQAVASFSQGYYFLF